MLWTLFILVGCLFPGRELPHTSVPFADKWTHFVMFGLFTFLWLLALDSISRARLVKVFVIATLYGAVVEILQGLLAFLGRSAELMDAVADAVGALLGVLVYVACARAAKTTSP